VSPRKITGKGAKLPIKKKVGGWIDGRGRTETRSTKKEEEVHVLQLKRRANLKKKTED